MIKDEDKDLPLRDDLLLLARLLNDTLLEQEGQDTFQTITLIRSLAERFVLEKDPTARHELEQQLNELSHDNTIALVRAFSYFSHLSNIAEDLHHNRRRPNANRHQSHRRRQNRHRYGGGVAPSGERRSRPDRDRQNFCRVRR